MTEGIPKGTLPPPEVWLGRGPPGKEEGPRDAVLEEGAGLRYRQKLFVDFVSLENGTVFQATCEEAVYTEIHIYIYTHRYIYIYTLFENTKCDAWQAAVRALVSGFVLLLESHSARWVCV